MTSYKIYYWYIFEGISARGTSKLNTERQFLSPIRSDAVKEGSVGVFMQNTLHRTDWLRTNVGWRGYQTSVNSFFTPANSGSANAFIGSPKFGVVFWPFAKTEFFVNAGEGFTATTRAA
ncbi:MAG: TonB-dependent receptor [Xanthobacteraceae bacterium]|nr:TonB-dependent receptor [Xanthobacteraceae bacterium]